MPEFSLEQISIVYLGAAAVSLLVLWMFFSNFKLPPDWQQKEKLRLEMKLKLLESESLAKQAPEDNAEESQSQVI